MIDKCSNVTRILLQMLPSSMGSGQVLWNRCVHVIGKSSKWRIFAFPQVDRTSLGHKHYHQPLIHDQWSSWQNTRKTLATTMKKLWPEHPWWKLLRRIQTENYQKRLWQKVFTYHRSSAITLLKRSCVFFTCSMVYIAVLINKTLIGKRQNMMPLSMTATILKILWNN